MFKNNFNILNCPIYRIISVIIFKGSRYFDVFQRACGSLLGYLLNVEAVGLRGLHLILADDFVLSTLHLETEVRGVNRTIGILILKF